MRLMLNSKATRGSAPTCTCASSMIQTATSPLQVMGFPLPAAILVRETRRATSSGTLESHMNTIRRSFTMILLAGAITLGLSACNTFRGIGKDTQVVGEKIEDKADEKQKQQQKQPNRP